ncbi:MAG TPA: hypothetical protein VK615_04440, partial [Candidatus Binatia bacterium]|nr:hypothetical protein [Candidatus Binatia bacterium]
QIAVVSIFAPTALNRFEVALNARTIISFPVKQHDVEIQSIRVGSGRPSRVSPATENQLWRNSLRMGGAAIPFGLRQK